MLSGRALSAALLAVAASFTVVTLWLAFDNPDIDGTSRGDNYTCLAPWDTALNGADNFPGGEPPPDGDAIAARCSDAGRDRFRLAVGGGVLATAFALASVAALLRDRRRAAVVT